MDEMVERAADRLGRGSKSFAAAARLLPRDKRASIVLLYSWCRHCDDVIDDEHLGFEASTKTSVPLAERLEHLRLGTLAALQGTAQAPEFRALQRVVTEHGMPERYPLEMIGGMAMDAAGTKFHTIEDTLRYCYHVAGVVGVMSAIILGVRDRPTLERASDLGIAFQLTNIARDVVADARRGRVYLPRMWLEDADIGVDRLDRGESRKALFQVVERLLVVSDCYYRSASAGIAQLPLRSAWAIASARRVYRGIGGQVRTLGPASWNGRISTRRREKLAATVLAAADALVLTALPAPTSASRDGLWTPEALIA
jgi:phytoene synthase